MAAPDLRQQLLDEIAELPASLTAEVVDFILFLKDRHAEDAYLWQQVEATYEHRAQHPDDVRTLDADEVRLLSDSVTDRR